VRATHARRTAALAAAVLLCGCGTAGGAKSNVASSYGAAGALIILLLWIFYSAQIFLLGAEFTRAFARRYGSHAGREVSNPIPS